MGINWLGVELEEKFVNLGNQNIDLWNSRYKGRLPKWGEAVLLQGDSRGLAEVLKGAGFAGMISSPPFMSVQGFHDKEFSDQWGPKQSRTTTPAGYGSHPAQLGNMREGELGEVLADAVISSPAYVRGCQHTGGDDLHPEHVQGGPIHHVDYGQSEGQLAAMPEGGAPVACIASPPTSQPIASYNDGGSKMGKKWRETGQTPRQRSSDGKLPSEQYGSTPGNLAQLPEGDAPVACISSPPWEGVGVGGTKNVVNLNTQCVSRGRPDAIGSGQEARGLRYAEHTEGQIGAEASDTFWSAARAIVQQVYQVLAPGGEPVQDQDGVDFCTC